MKCPQCRHYIEDGSESHICGWNVHTVEVKPVTPEDLAARSAAEIQPQAEATCERLGLKTVEEKRAWVKANFGVYKPLPTSESDIEAKREIARRVAGEGA